MDGRKMLVGDPSSKISLHPSCIEVAWLNKQKNSQSLDFGILFVDLQQSR